MTYNKQPYFREKSERMFIVMKHEFEFTLEGS